MSFPDLPRLDLSAFATSSLQGRFVRLEPMAEAHKEGLRAACDADPDTWLNLYPWPMHGEHFEGRWVQMAKDKAAGHFLCFAVVLDGECVGMTSFITPDAVNKSVEIGGTYYHPRVRGGPVNPECKYLLMRSAFDAGAVRVELKTDARNARSRAAILKLGAKEEGILRRHIRMPDGHIRDTVYFSVLDHEWPAVRAGLEARLNTFS
mgnify:CR=1 FL=1